MRNLTNDHPIIKEDPSLIVITRSELLSSKNPHVQSYINANSSGLLFSSATGSPVSFQEVAFEFSRKTDNGEVFSLKKEELLSLRRGIDQAQGDSSRLRDLLLSSNILTEHQFESLKWYSQIPSYVSLKLAGGYDEGIDPTSKRWDEKYFIGDDQEIYYQHKFNSLTIIEGAFADRTKEIALYAKAVYKWTDRGPILEYIVTDSLLYKNLVMNGHEGSRIDYFSPPKTELGRVRDYALAYRYKSELYASADVNKKERVMELHRKSWEIKGVDTSAAQEEKYKGGEDSLEDLKQLCQDWIKEFVTSNKISEHYQNKYTEEQLATWVWKYINEINMPINTLIGGGGMDPVARFYLPDQSQPSMLCFSEEKGLHITLNKTLGLAEITDAMDKKVLNLQGSDLFIKVELVATLDDCEGEPGFKVAGEYSSNIDPNDLKRICLLESIITSGFDPQSLQLNIHPSLQTVNYLEELEESTGIFKQCIELAKYLSAFLGLNISNSEGDEALKSAAKSAATSFFGHLNTAMADNVATSKDKETALAGIVIALAEFKRCARDTGERKAVTEAENEKDSLMTLVDDILSKAEDEKLIRSNLNLFLMRKSDNHLAGKVYEEWKNEHQVLSPRGDQGQLDMPQDTNARRIQQGYPKVDQLDQALADYNASAQATSDLERLGKVDTIQSMIQCIDHRFDAPKGMQKYTLPELKKALSVETDYLLRRMQLSSQYPDHGLVKKYQEEQEKFSDPTGTAEVAALESQPISADEEATLALAKNIAASLKEKNVHWDESAEQAFDYAKQVTRSKVVVRDVKGQLNRYLMNSHSNCFQKRIKPGHDDVAEQEQAILDVDPDKLPGNLRSGEKDAIKTALLALRMIENYESTINAREEENDYSNIDDYAAIEHALELLKEKRTTERSQGQELWGRYRHNDSGESRLAKALTITPPDQSWASLGGKSELVVSSDILMSWQNAISAIKGDGWLDKKAHKEFFLADASVVRLQEWSRSFLQNPPTALPPSPLSPVGLNAPGIQFGEIQEITSADGSRNDVEVLKNKIEESITELQVQQKVGQFQEKCKTRKAVDEEEIELTKQVRETLAEINELSLASCIQPQLSRWAEDTIADIVKAADDVKKALCVKDKEYIDATSKISSNAAESIDAIRGEIKDSPQINHNKLMEMLGKVYSIATRATSDVIAIKSDAVAAEHHKIHVILSDLNQGSKHCFEALLKRYVEETWPNLKFLKSPESWFQSGSDNGATYLNATQDILALKQVFESIDRKYSDLRLEDKGSQTSEDLLSELARLVPILEGRLSNYKEYYEALESIQKVCDFRVKANELAANEPSPVERFKSSVDDFKTNPGVFESKSSVAEYRDSLNASFMLKKQCMVKEGCRAIAEQRIGELNRARKSEAIENNLALAYAGFDSISSLLEEGDDSSDVLKFVEEKKKEVKRHADTKHKEVHENEYRSMLADFSDKIKLTTENTLTEKQVLFAKVALRAKQAYPDLPTDLVDERLYALIYDIPEFDRTKNDKALVAVQDVLNECADPWSGETQGDPYVSLVAVLKKVLPENVDGLKKSSLQSLTALLDPHAIVSDRRTTNQLQQIMSLGDVKLKSTEFEKIVEAVKGLGAEHHGDQGKLLLALGEYWSGNTEDDEVHASLSTFDDLLVSSDLSSEDRADWERVKSTVKQEKQNAIDDNISKFIKRVELDICSADMANNVQQVTHDPRFAKIYDEFFLSRPGHLEQNKTFCTQILRDAGYKVVCLPSASAPPVETSTPKKRKQGIFSFFYSDQPEAQEALPSPVAEGDKALGHSTEKQDLSTPSSC
jgi:hypothetical protein